MVAQNLANLLNLEDLKLEDILWNEDNIKIIVKFRIEHDIKNYNNLKNGKTSKWSQSQNEDDFRQNKKLR